MLNGGWSPSTHRVGWMRRSHPDLWRRSLDGTELRAGLKRVAMQRCLGCACPVRIFRRATLRKKAAFQALQWWAATLTTRSTRSALVMPRGFPTFDVRPDADRDER